MLSRVADSVYWVSRYIERAENVARFIDVNYNLTLGDGEQLGNRWDPLVFTTGDHETFTQRYGQATRVREGLARDFARAFEEVDVLASPTSPTPAFALGERRDDPVAMYAADVLTVPANLAGLPAVSAGELLQRLIRHEHDDQGPRRNPKLETYRAGRAAIVSLRLAIDPKGALSVFTANDQAALGDAWKD